mmetsp:Transcript_20795/g.31769  ORF Transcript_20795/g.31769 Transcript_20795/m.31769 type:complete len:197 (-) Transcript_20795:30-620(-)
MEELQIRIQGQVESFGSPMEAAPWWTAATTSSVYHHHYASKGRRRHSNNNNNKPHAVVAHGHALKIASPRSLMLLMKYCEHANVPLFVLNDVTPSWRRTSTSNHDNNAYIYNNTDEDMLQHAMQDIRRVVKQNIVLDILSASHHYHQNKDKEDWSKWNQDQLIQELMRRNVITEKGQDYKFSRGMLDLLRQFQQKK